MILELAAFAQLASACAPPTTWDLLRKIAATESAFNTLAVHDNGTNKEYTPGTEAEAAALAHYLIDGGHSVDLGLMQINSHNLDDLALSVEAAFDPCNSISAGARILGLVSAYNTGSMSRGFANGYVQKVVTGHSERGHTTASAQSSRQQPTVSPLGDLESHDWDLIPDWQKDEQQPEQTASAVPSPELSTDLPTPSEPLGPLVVSAIPEERHQEQIPIER
jgi:hypothetical protein